MYKKYEQFDVKCVVYQIIISRDSQSDKNFLQIYKLLKMLLFETIVIFKMGYKLFHHNKMKQIINNKNKPPKKHS